MGQDWDGVAVCALALAVYINTLGHGFVYDDHRAILTNPDVQPSTPIFQVFQNDFWGTPLSSSSSHGSYRPLTVLSFRLNVWTAGLRPLGFHLTNVLLHAVATGLVLKTARVLLPGRSPTLAAAVFAVHPIHAEAVTGIVGRADVLAAIFYLLSFLFYVNHVKLREKNVQSSIKLGSASKVKPVTKKCSSKTSVEFCFTIKDRLYLKSIRKILLYPRSETFFYTLFLIFAVLAVLSKEPAITVIPLALCYDIILHLRSTKLQFCNSSIVSSACASMSAFVLIALVRVSLMGLHTPSFSKADNPIARDSSIVTRTLSFLYLPLFNFILLLFPKSLSFDWSMEAIPKIHSIFEYRYLVTLLFYILIIQSVKVLFNLADFKRLMVVSKHKSCKTCNKLYSETHLAPCILLNNNNLPQKCICSNFQPLKLNTGSAGMLCLAFVVLPFIPASNLFFYVGFVVAERVLYIPSVGFCLLVALGSHVLWTQGRKSLVLVCCLLLLTSLAARTLQRNKDWRDEESLYRSATSINPPKAYGNLGSVLSTLGRLDEAEATLRLALRHRPTMADVHYNLGNLLNRQGKYEEAIKSYKDAINYRPSLAVAYLNLGQTLETTSRLEEAEKVYSKCVKLEGNGLKDPRAHVQATSSCYRMLKRLCGETECGPDTSKIIVDQDKAFGKEDFKDRGTKDRMDPKNDLNSEEYLSSKNNYVHHLQNILKNKTVLSGEEELFLKAILTSPNNAANYVAYGQLLVKQGRRGEAASLYLRAAQLQPHHHPLVVTAAVALRHAGRLGEAEAMYRRARDIRPQDATSHSNLGAILHLQGKHQQAAASYREALRLSPGDRVTLTNLQKLNTLLSRTKR